MFIACLQRHLAVCALAELPAFTKRDQKFWNVISLLGPQSPSPTKVNFRDHYRAHFDDVCAAPSTNAESGGVVVSSPTMRGVLKFVDDRPGQPILVHCVAGISRSPAAVLVLLLRGLIAAGDAMPVQTSMETLLTIRPQARPNPLVLQTGLECFLSASEAKRLAERAMEFLRASGSTASESD